MSNQLRVQVNSDEKVYFPDSFGGIDTNNIIASLDNGATITATEDCFIVVSIGNEAWEYIIIDGVRVTKGYSTGYRSSTVFAFAKKGQSIKVGWDNNGGYGILVGM